MWTYAWKIVKTAYWVHKCCTKDWFNGNIYPDLNIYLYMQHVVTSYYLYCISTDKNAMSLNEADCPEHCLEENTEIQNMTFWGKIS